MCQADVAHKQSRPPFSSLTVQPEKFWVSDTATSSISCCDSSKASFVQTRCVHCVSLRKMHQTIFLQPRQPKLVNARTTIYFFLPGGELR